MIALRNPFMCQSAYVPFGSVGWRSQRVEPLCTLPAEARNDFHGKNPPSSPIRVRKSRTSNHPVDVVRDPGAGPEREDRGE